MDLDALEFVLLVLEASLPPLSSHALSLCSPLLPLTVASFILLVDFLSKSSLLPLVSEVPLASSFLLLVSFSSLDPSAFVSLLTLFAVVFAFLAIFATLIVIELVLLTTSAAAALFLIGHASAFLVFLSQQLVPASITRNSVAAITLIAEVLTEMSLVNFERTSTGSLVRGTWP